MKTNGQPDRLVVEKAGRVRCGASNGAAVRDWTVPAEGSIPSSSTIVTVAQLVERPIGSRFYAGSSPARHPQLMPRRQLVASNGACPRAEAKEQGCDTAVILAHAPEESKGQNDVPQLQNGVQAIW